MGGNQSKAYTDSDFTFEQSSTIMANNTTKINTFMDQNAVVEAISEVQEVKINGNTNSTINIKALSTAELKTAQEIAGSLEQLSNPEMSGLVALDVMNAIKNQNAQDISAQIANKSESTVVTKTKFDINNCIEVCNQLNLCVDLASNLVAKANSVIKKVEITANANCNINLEAVSTAKMIATQLASFISKAANEISQETQLNAKFMNDMDQSNEQTQKMLENLANQMSALGQEIAKQAGETARSWGDGLFGAIGDSKWLILGPILAIIAIIALIIVFKLVKGSGNNDKELKKLELELESKRLQQMQQQQQMYSPMVMSQMYPPMQPQMMPQQSMQPQQMMPQQSMQPQQMQMMPQQMQMMPQQQM